MEQVYLVGEKECRINSANTLLQYYLMEKSQEVRSSKLYGIKIVKIVTDGKGSKQEEEMTPAISYSKAFVKQILLAMLKGTVTPVSVLEIVDDLVSEHLNYQ